MAEVSFVGGVHGRAKRDYLERVVRGDKAACAEVAKRFGEDYWDGDRRHGYGGFVYDGRWVPVARRLAEHYGLRAGSRVLDVGCGKAFLLHDLLGEVPGLEVRGIDVSGYALERARPEVRPFLDEGSADALPYGDGSFDLVLSINTLHNLPVERLARTLGEIERVKRRPGGGAYLVVESFRNEEEKANLLHWQLTCEAFFRPASWLWLFERCGYTGDWEFVFFE